MNFKKLLHLFFIVLLLFGVSSSVFSKETEDDFTNFTNMLYKNQNKINSNKEKKPELQYQIISTNDVEESPYLNITALAKDEEVTCIGKKIKTRIGNHTIKFKIKEFVFKRVLNGKEMDEKKEDKKTQEVLNEFKTKESLDCCSNNGCSGNCGSNNCLNCLEGGYCYDPCSTNTLLLCLVCNMSHHHNHGGGVDMDCCFPGDCLSGCGGFPAPDCPSGGGDDGAACAIILPCLAVTGIVVGAVALTALTVSCIIVTPFIGYGLIGGCLDCVETVKISKPMTLSQALFKAEKKELKLIDINQNSKILTFSDAFQTSSFWLNKNVIEYMYKLELEFVECEGFQKKDESTVFNEELINLNYSLNGSNEENRSLLNN